MRITLELMEGTVPMKCVNTGIYIQWKPQKLKSDYSNFSLTEFYKMIGFFSFSLALLESDSYFEVFLI